MPRPTRIEAEEAVRTLIRWAGDDPARDGVANTPTRVVEDYAERFSGYGEGAAEWKIEKAPNNSTVLARNIPFFSHCEHHMVPFLGVFHIAYLPRDSVAARSNVSDMVNVFARRLQSQERLTTEVLTAIQEALNPHGVAVLVESEHLCMTIRGVHKHGAATATMKFSGVFREDPKERQQVLASLLGGDKSRRSKQPLGHLTGR